MGEENRKCDGGALGSGGRNERAADSRFSRPCEGKRAYEVYEEGAHRTPTTGALSRRGVSAPLGCSCEYARIKVIRGNSGEKGRKRDDFSLKILRTTEKKETEAATAAPGGASRIHSTSIGGHPKQKRPGEDSKTPEGKN